MTPDQFKALKPGDKVLRLGEHNIYTLGDYVPPKDTGLSFGGYRLGRERSTGNLLWEDELEKWNVWPYPVGTVVYWKNHDLTGVVMGQYEDINALSVMFDEERPSMFHDCNGDCPPNRGYWLASYDLVVKSWPAPPSLKDRLTQIWERALL